LFGGTVTGIVALGLIHGRSLALGDPRRTIALMTAVFGLGQVIGPTFAGVVFDLSGSFMAPSLAAAAALFAAAVLVGTSSRSL
jgi:predicted MFS family arabinose efflux permease